MAVRIELLGGLRVLLDEETRSIPVSHKAGALLAYLAYRTGEEIPRDVLIEVLWPDVEAEAGRMRLRTVLSELRKLLAGPCDPEAAFLVATRSSVKLDDRRVSIDVREFQLGAESSDGDAERLAAALALYRGELLPGSYEDWVIQERERLARLRVSALGRLATTYAQEGDFGRAAGQLETAIASDPLNEAARCELMRIHIAAGRPAAALQQFAEMDRLLKDELGVEPGEEAQSLAAEARAYRPNPARETRPIQSPPAAPVEHRPTSPAYRPLPRTSLGRLPLLIVGSLMLAAAAFMLLRSDPATSPETRPPGVSGVQPGGVQWKRVLSKRAGDKSSEAKAATADASGNVYVIAMVDNGKTDVDIVTTSYTPDGTLRWQSDPYNGPGNDMDRPVATHTDATGFLYVVGESLNSKGNGTTRLSGLDWVILKYRLADGRLDSSWPDVGFGVGVRRYNGLQDGEDRPTHIVGRTVLRGKEVISRDLFVLGTSRSRRPGANPFEDTVLLRYNDRGVVKQLAEYSSPLDDTPGGLAISATGSAYFAVSSARRTSNGFAERDVSLVKIAADGKKLWERSYGKANHADDFAHFVGLDRGENVYVAGLGPSPTVMRGTLGAFALKFRSDGEPIWAHGFPRPGEQITEFARALFWHDGEGLIIAGTGPNENGRRVYRTLLCTASGLLAWVRDLGDFASTSWGGGTALGVDDWYVYFSVASDENGTAHFRRDILTTAIGRNGALIWQAREPGTGPCNRPSGVFFSGGGVVVAGQTGEYDGADTTGESTVIKYHR